MHNKAISISKQQIECRLYSFKRDTQVQFFDMYTRHVPSFRLHLGSWIEKSHLKQKEMWKNPVEIVILLNIRIVDKQIGKKTSDLKEVFTIKQRMQNMAWALFTKHSIARTVSRL